jgi:hypothetical protein
MATDGHDSISVIVNLGERCTASQRGRNVELGAGGAIAVLHEVPAEVTFAERVVLQPVRAAGRAGMTRAARRRRDDAAGVTPNRCGFWRAT